MSRHYKDFEDFLREKHAETYGGSKDNMYDDYEEWLVDLDVDRWIVFGNQYAKVCNPF